MYAIGVELCSTAATSERYLTDPWSFSRCHVHQCGIKMQLQTCRCNLPVCPRCRFPRREAALGHCRKAGAIRNCRPPPSNDGNEGDEGDEGIASSTRFIGNNGETSVGPGQCPSIHAQTWPGHRQDYMAPDSGAYVFGDYAERDVRDEYILDDFGYGEDLLTSIPPEFSAVSTPEQLRRALRAGVNHIVVTQHMDAVDARAERDFRPHTAALNSALGRVKTTTLTIKVGSSLATQNFPRAVQCGSGCACYNGREYTHTHTPCMW